MVTPLIAWHFGSISWLAPLTNAFILPLISWLMGLGLLGLVFSPFLWLAYPLLWWSVWVVTKFSFFPNAELPLKLSWWQVIFSYLLIFLLVKRKKNE